MSSKWCNHCLIIIVFSQIYNFFFTGLRAHTRPHVHTHTSVISGLALAAHKTQIECEISTHTFMSADLHYIISIPHHGSCESDQGQS